jgi:glycosyltransferase involved in cell wall biosynthesis
MSYSSLAANRACCLRRSFVPSHIMVEEKTQILPAEPPVRSAGETPAQGEHDSAATTARMLSTLAAAEASLAELERDHAADSPASKRTSLAVSVVIPVFNERDTIRQVVERVLGTGYATEVIVVDDCSTDGTRDVLLELDAIEGVRVFMHGYNKGKGAALHTAFDQVTGDVVLIQDADLEYNPADYGKLLAPIEAGEADVVFGSRFLENARQDPSWVHRFGNRMLTWMSNTATGLRLTDMETGYKVFRRGAIREMVLREKRFGFEPELTAKLARRKCRIQEVPVGYASRGYDQGKKIHLVDALRAVYCIVRYSWWD